MNYFKGSVFVAICGLTLAYLIGGITGLWIAFVLSVLEISLSFDNAVVNAQVLKTMDYVWRHRFITWGMAIAVFGMRLLFPLIIVAVALKIGPLEAGILALKEPHLYAEALESVHVSVMGFGGSFLALVCTKFFIDDGKEIHWIRHIEDKLTTLGKIEAIQSALVLIVVYFISLLIEHYHNQSEAHSFLVASIFGIVTYVVVDGIEVFVAEEEEAALSKTVVKSGLASFLYLEVLDASFSFDGVLGALALSNNIFIIAIGLGIGAMFVRSLTIMMTEKGTVDQFEYLEHGAFWAIGSLAAIMYASTLIEIPETITGLIGATFIGASIFSSLRIKED